MRANDSELPENDIDRLTLTLAALGSNVARLKDNLAALIPMLDDQQQKLVSLKEEIVTRSNARVEE